MYLRLEDSVFMQLNQPTNWSTFHELRNTTRVQEHLYNYLFDDYNKNLKPTFSITAAVNVTFRLLLYQLLSVDEPHQSLTVNAWITETWTDQQLLWNPSEFENISSITVPYDTVWMPDTVLYNTLTTDDEEIRRLLNVRIHAIPKINSALVELMYPTILSISCKFNVRYFPFDTQNCTLLFGSWTSDSSDIDYYPDILDQRETLGNLVPNEEWKVVSLTARRKSLKYACCPTSWINVEYYLVLKRQPLYYVINLIIPTSIIVFICMVGFFTPTTPQGERNEKVTLGITTLLALAILLLTVSDHLPTTSQYVAMIGWYFLSQIVIIAVGTVVASFIICIQHRARHDCVMSDTTYALICWMAKFACLHIPSSFKRKTKSKLCKRILNPSSSSTKVLMSDSSSEEHQCLTWHAVKSDKLMRSDKASSSERDTFQLVDFSKDTSSKLNGNIPKKNKKKIRRVCPDYSNPTTVATEEWDLAASVLERMALFIFTSLSIISGLVVLIIGYFFV